MYPYCVEALGIVLSGFKYVKSILKELGLCMGTFNTLILELTFVSLMIN